MKNKQNKKFKIIPFCISLLMVILVTGGIGVYTTFYYGQTDVKFLDKYFDIESKENKNLPTEQYIEKALQLENKFYSDAYKIAFSTPQPLFFDEDTFIKIIAKNKYKTTSLHIADLKPRLKHFHILNENNYKAQCFVWHKGKLERYYSEDGKNIKREEFTYIHFLKRPITIENGIDITKPLIIIPNKIFNMPLNKITPEFLLEVNKKGVTSAYFKKKCAPKEYYYIEPLPTINNLDYIKGDIY